MFAHRAQESNRAAAGTVLKFTCFKRSYFTISAANNSALWRQPLDGLLTSAGAKLLLALSRIVVMGSEADRPR